MNAATWQFEDSAVDQLITALCVAPVQFGAATVWTAMVAISWFVGCLAENWQPLAKLAGLIVATLIVVSVWQIGVGVAVVAALTWMAKRGGKI